MEYSSFLCTLESCQGCWCRVVFALDPHQIWIPSDWYMLLRNLISLVCWDYGSRLGHLCCWTYDCCSRLFRGCVFSASCLTSGNIRICRTSPTRDGNVLWFLVLYHGCSCSADNRMYALLHLTDKTTSAIDDAALLDDMFVSVSIS